MSRCQIPTFAKRLSRLVWSLTALSSTPDVHPYHAEPTDPRGQFGAIAVSLLLFIVFTIAVGFAWSWFFLIPLIFFVSRYFLVGTVPAASVALSQNNFELARQYLRYTWKPDWLRLGMKPLYHFMHAMLALQDKDFPKAERLIKKSVELGLPADDNLVVAYINLAGIYIRQKRRQDAKKYVHMARKIGTKNPQLLAVLGDMEKVLAQGRL